LCSAGGHEFPDPKLADRVKVIAVDEGSVAEVGRWPWPRGVMANLVNAVCGDPFATPEDDEGWEDTSQGDDGWEDAPADDGGAEAVAADDGWEDAPAEDGGAEAVAADDEGQGAAADDGWEDVPEEENQDTAQAEPSESQAPAAEPAKEKDAEAQIGSHRVLGIDILLDRTERDYRTFLWRDAEMMDPEQMDAMMRDSLQQCDRVVNSSLMKFPKPGMDVGKGDEVEKYKDKDGDIVWFNKPLKAYQLENSSIGFVNVEASRFDSRIRKALLYYKLDGRIEYSFPLVNVANFAGVPLDEIKVEPGRVIVGPYTIPVDAQGRIYINYSGFVGKRYDPTGKKGFPIGESTQISAIDIMKTPETIPFTLQGNYIFLIGVSDKEMKDIEDTPFGMMPGVDIHKAVIDTILQQDFLKDAAPWKFVLALALGAALVAGFALYRMWAGAIALVAYGGGYVLYTVHAFSGAGEIYPMVPVLAALPVSLVCGMLYRNFVVDREKNAVKNIFKSYVAPHVLAELMDNPEDLRLGGKSSKVSILFSDIRGFTTISEQLTADQLISALNHYLEHMTDIVLNNSGMIDKFIGDAVMAIWGAPVPHEDDAAKAVSAALKMEPCLDRINPYIKEITGLEFAIGVGVNTGEAKLGNIGSKGKLDYTVIGDAVNLASRLEGLTKQYGAFLIISEFTYAEVKDKFDCRYLDDVMVKGKDKPVGIYQVLSEKGKLDDKKKQNMDHFHKGRELYKAMKFDEAIEEFEKALAIDSHDKASKMYAHERCPHYKDAPPSPGWDGAFRMTTK